MGCFRTGKEAQMMPVFASTTVQMPLTMKLYVMSDWFLREFDTAVVRRMLVIVTLQDVSGSRIGTKDERWIRTIHPRGRLHRAAAVDGVACSIDTQAAPEAPEP